jgi:Ni,Fe-hydrogenase I cytochrome b subunit
MKWVTFAVAFLLTVALVIAGVAVYPEVLGKAASANNDYVFAFFLGPFFFVLFFAWMGEKVVLRLWKKKSSV